MRILLYSHIVISFYDYVLIFKWYYMFILLPYYSMIFVCISVCVSYYVFISFHGVVAQSHSVESRGFKNSFRSILHFLNCYITIVTLYSVLLCYH